MARLDPHSYFDSKQPLTKALRLKLDLDFQARIVRGEASLDFGAPVGGTLDLDTRSLSVRSARTDSGREVSWEIGEADPVLGQRLRLDLPEGTRQLRIEYDTSPSAMALQWLSAGQTAGKAHPFLFSQCQPHHARSLAPLQDSPRVRVPYEAEVTLPEPLVAVMSAGSEGSQAGPDSGRRTFRFKMPQPIPTYLIALAAGNLESRELGPRSRIWSEPETCGAAAYEFAEIERMIQTAETLFGPYDWDRYDLLVLPPSFPYGGMENPRLTFLTPTLLAGDRSLVAVVAHELAHSWTGNLVTNATMNDFWLNEGFTVWAERRLLEALYGGDYAALSWAIGMNHLQSALERFGPDSPFTRLRQDLWDVDPDSVYSEVPYEKGARFVVLLERAVGREKFGDFIRAYMKKFRFTSITTEEFMAFLDRELPGVSARVNAEAWLYESDLPPGAPTFPSERVQALRSLSEGWSRGRRPTADEADAFSPLEMLVYLQGLPRPMPLPDCAWLDGQLHLTGRGNYEILVEWLTVAAASGFEPVLPRLKEVLTTVGRMKYLKPLYAALGHAPKTRAWARGVYAQARDSYHPLSRMVVEEVLRGYPED